MIAVWLRGLILAVQYVYPLIMALQIVRKQQITSENKEQITRLFIYFMIQAVWNLCEYNFSLWL